MEVGELLGGKEGFGGAEEVVFFVAKVPLEYPVQASNGFPELGHLARGWVGTCGAKAIRKPLPLGIHFFVGFVQGVQRGPQFGMTSLDLDVLFEEFFDCCCGGVIQAEGGEQDVFFLGHVEFKALLHEPFEMKQPGKRIGDEFRVFGGPGSLFGGDSSSIDRGVDEQMFANKPCHGLQSDFDFRWQGRTPPGIR